jgi:hypothetical protein
MESEPGGKIPSIEIDAELEGSNLHTETRGEHIPITAMEMCNVGRTTVLFLSTLSNDKITDLNAKTLDDNKHCVEMYIHSKDNLNVKVKLKTGGYEESSKNYNLYNSEIIHYTQTLPTIGISNAAIAIHSFLSEIFKNSYRPYSGQTEGLVSELEFNNKVIMIKKYDDIWKTFTLTESEQGHPLEFYRSQLLKDS